MVERVLGSHGLGPMLRRQNLDQRLIESELATIDKPERGRRGDHLRNRGDPEAGLARDRDLVASVGDAAGVLEEGSAGVPDEGHAAEFVRFDPVIEPSAKRIGVHRGIVTVTGVGAASGAPLQRMTRRRGRRDPADGDAR